MSTLHRLTAVATIGVCVVLGASACVSSSAQSSGNPTAPVTSIPMTTAAVSPSATSASPTSPPISKATPTEKPANSGTIKCSVTNTTLFAALKANASMYDKAGSPSALEAPACVTGFAVAKDVDNPSGGEPGYVLFRYNATKQTWTPVNVGTSGFCKGYVTPASLASSLPGCGG